MPTFLDENEFRSQQLDAAHPSIQLNSLSISSTDAPNSALVGGEATLKSGKMNLYILKTAYTAGWLYKKGGRPRVWKKRWFHLRKDHFAYYKDAQEYETRQVVPIDTISGISSKAGGKRPALSLYVGSREVHLQAETQEDADDWVYWLKSAVKLSTHPVSGPASPLDIITSSPRRQNSSFNRRGDMPISTSIQFANSVESSSFMSPPIVGHSLSGSLMTSDDECLNAGFSDMSTAEDDLSPTSDNSPHGDLSTNTNRSLPSTSDKVVVQGYLTRHHLSKPRRSVKVWAVLRPQALSLYPDHNEYCPQKVVAIKDIIDAAEFESEGTTSGKRDGGGGGGGNKQRDANKAWRFQVITKEKALRFSVDREETLDAWVGGLKSRIEQEELRRVRSNE